MNLAKHLHPAAVPIFDYDSLDDEGAAEAVRASTTKIHDMQRAAVVEIGRELIAVKERLPAGKFLEWIEAEFGWGRRTTVNMMQVAAVFGSTWETVSHLPTAVIYRLAAPSTPDAVRTAVVETVGPQKVISVFDVRTLVDTLRTAETRKERKDRREEIRQEQDAARARWERQDANDRLEREQRREAASAAVERMRDFMGPHFADLCVALATIEVHLFSAELVRVAQEVRARQAIWGGERGPGFDRA